VPPVEQLLVRLAERDAVIAALTARVAELEARLARNSQNSSKPPSADNPFAKPPPRSSRKPTGRGRGGQPGQRGSRLESVAEPEQTVVHRPQCCQGCGTDLAAATVVDESVRQVFDVAPIRVRVVEHRVQRRRCRCGHLTSGVFPAEATAPTCYGPAITAVATYLMARQHVPVERTREMLRMLYGVSVSTGWLAGLVPRAAAGLEGFRSAAAARLHEAPVAHFDETGARAAAQLWWVHVACTGEFTLYHRAPSRGQASMDLGGVLPHFHGVAVHDGLTSYRRYPIEHGLCGAHHLRELAGIGEVTGQDWPQQLADLLIEMNTAVNDAKAAGQDRLPAHRLAAYRTRYHTLIDLGQAANPPPPRTGKAGRPRLGPAGALLRRFDIYADDVLRFATDFTVPFDNNQAERDIRMIRLQQKISGGWRCENGLDAFLTVRSYLSTARKHGHEALDVLRDLFTGHPWLPAPT
jgi:transposase